MDLLWPDSGRKSASNSLRRTLHATRGILDPVDGSGYLVSEDKSLVLRPSGGLWVDVDAFEEAAATARRSREPAAHRAALDLYAGELLPADRYEGWAEEKRVVFRRLYLDLLVELAMVYEERGDLARAGEALQTAVTEEPALEEAHADLMRLYALSGRESDALVQYERLRDALSRQLGAQPSTRTHSLREDISAGRFPITPTRPADPTHEDKLDATKHNLPASRSSFVGRGQDLVEIKRTLAMTRLLTLTGVGGSGKTRLALEVARDLVGAYPDGVWLVELAPLSEDQLVARTVAEVLAVPERPQEPLSNTLSDVLRDREMLLVLDNCEHLVETTARLVDVLLDSCLCLRVLATSREALGVEGEIRWPVRPLSVPERGRTPASEQLEGYESIRLFVERARGHDPSFSLNPQKGKAVADICRTLEGIPLCVELAAARVGTLSLERISERLESSLELLTRGGRTAAPRQRTLKGTLDWSHDLLNEPERNLFRRLSVFAGGWTLEAAEVVRTGEGAAQEEVLDLLSGLVEKSLVVAEPPAEGEARYRLLEPIRQYAREKLEDRGEARTVRQMHASFFLALAEEANLKLRGPQTTVWLGRLEPEYDNLRAALSWSLEGGDLTLGLRLSAALWMYWRTRGYLSEASQWLEEALAKGAAVEPAARAGALRGMGYVLREQNDLQRSEACFKKGLALYEELGDKERVADSLASLGWVAQYQGDAARATAFFERSLATARGSGNQAVIPSVLNGMAFIAREGRDFGRAQELWGEALEVAREQGDLFEAATILKNMGYTELAWDNHERSTELIEEALVLGRKIGNRFMETDCLAILGTAAALRGDPQHAKSLLQESLVFYLELGLKANVAESLERLAETAGALGEDVRAARLWGAAETMRETFGISWTLAERMLHEPRLRAARTQLGEAAWKAAFAEGEAMGLEEAVEYALSEERPTTASTVAPEHASSDQRPALTRREREVANLVTQGLTNRQIAARLVISESTAETHLARIFKKVGLHSRTQLTVWVNGRGLSSSNSS
jgi:predicted ATPase/DNA-binding SARP family transcriptional activator/DNA-binding CsgD family transcriptional regulator